MKKFREDWTDNMAFVGATQREAQQDYYMWRALRPEWFLGYCVFVGTRDPRYWQGLRVSRAMITHRATQSELGLETMECLENALTFIGSPRRLEIVL